MSLPSLSHKTQDILHEFMELQYLSQSEFDALIGHLFPTEDNAEIDCDNYIREMNSVIKLHKMEISKVRDEKDGTTNYVLVNLADNARSRKSTLTPEHHLEFFNRILTAILTSDDKSIPVTDAINLALETSGTSSNRKSKISIGQAEELTEKWLTSHMLDRNDDQDRLVLGFVALAEFGHFIKDHYPDSYNQCPSCKLLCLRGVTCRSCSGKTHVHCSGCPVSDHISSFECLTCRTN